MEEAKRSRANNARKLTRRVNELLNAVKTCIDKKDVEDKICTVKYNIDELGVLQDEVLANIEDNDKGAFEKEVNGMTSTMSK